MKRLGLQSSIYNGLQLKDEIYTAKHHNISTFDIFFDTWSPSDIPEETYKLINELNDFLSSKREMINIDEMKIFYSNLQNLRFHFINTVSVDFSFINNLTEELMSDLKRQIASLVQNFKNEHLGSKYSE